MQHYGLIQASLAAPAAGSCLTLAGRIWGLIRKLAACCLSVWAASASGFTCNAHLA